MARWLGEVIQEQDLGQANVDWIKSDEDRAASKSVLEAIRGRRKGVKGGPGSGNFGHEGRPGEVGGSGGYDQWAIEASRVATPIERDTAECYAINGIEINTALRDGREDARFYTPSSRTFDPEVLDALIQKGVAPRDLEVFRSMAPEILKGMVVGDRFLYRGYTSTTVKESYATTHAVLRSAVGDQGVDKTVSVQIPQGSSMVALDRLNSSSGGGVRSMGEVLLPRSSTFQVVSLGDQPVIRLVKQ